MQITKPLLAPLRGVGGGVQVDLLMGINTATPESLFFPQLTLNLITLFKNTIIKANITGN